MTPTELARLGLSGLYNKLLEDRLGERPTMPLGGLDKGREALRSPVTGRFDRVWKDWAFTVTTWTAGDPVPLEVVASKIEELREVGLALAQTAAHLEAILVAHPGELAMQAVQGGVAPRRSWPSPNPEPVPDGRT